VVIFNAGFSPCLKRLDLAEKSLEILRRQDPSVTIGNFARGRIPHEAMPPLHECGGLFALDQRL
jgi:hypothetical protein